MCDGNSFGGVTGDMYATPFNTIGMGDVIPFGCNGYGSGDRTDKILTKKPAKKKKEVEDVSNTKLDMNPPLIVYTK